MQDYTDSHSMKINKNKSKVIPFNFTRKYDFIPNLTLGPDELEVVYETKLLGVICCSSGKWTENIKYLVKKANARLYFIRRLKSLGASIATLKEAFILFVRPMIEFCAPLWAGALYHQSGKALSESLERIQRSFCKLLFPTRDYESSIESLKLQKISERRLILTKRFGSKMAENPKFSYLFPKVTGKSSRSKRIYHEPKWKCTRYGFSTIPFCIRLLNNEIT